MKCFIVDVLETTGIIDGMLNMALKARQATITLIHFQLKALTLRFVFYLLNSI